MRKTLCLAAVVVLCLSSCGKITLNANPKFGPAPKPITNLAESIDRFSLTYDKATRQAKLDVSYFNVDVVGTDGLPVFTAIESLDGEVNEKGEAILKHAELTDFTAKLVCIDEACLKSEIELTHLGGKLAGTATLRQSTAEQADMLVSRKDSEPTQSVQERVWKLLGSHFYTTSFTITEIDGAKSLFSLKVTFSNEGLKPGDERYFVEKELGIGGEIEEKSSVRLVVWVKKLENEPLRGEELTPYSATVRYEKGSRQLSIVLQENEFTKKPEIDLTFDLRPGF
jgi:hypothetical protein